MMSDNFYDTIAGNPNDDTPRLVYADWLEERGEPERAEFIRIQCQRAKEKNQHPGVRERELLNQHSPRWLGQLNGIFHRRVFQRGFLEHASVRVQSLLLRREVVDQIGPIFNLTLVGANGHVALLAALPSLRWTRTLSLASNRLQDSDVQILVASPHLSHLRRLTLTHNKIRNAGTEAIASSPNLRCLRQLFLDDNHISNEGLLALAKSPHLASLTSLRLARNRVDPNRRGVGALVARFGTIVKM